MKLSTTFSTLAIAMGATARTITVRNSCPFTVWPGIYTGLGEGPKTGWEAPSMSSKVITVPDTWRAGRIWGRRNCDFSKPPVQDCLIGACIGGLECTQPGVPPVTLAEFTLRGADGLDNYDVSLVDGYGLTVKVVPSASACHVAECAVDLGPICPSPLKGPVDSNGVTLGCKTACTAKLDGNPNDSANCCTGSHDKPETCPPSGVQYYDFFKSNCRDAYAYAYDEKSGTALWTCEQKHNSDYTVIFCP